MSEYALYDVIFVSGLNVYRILWRTKRVEYWGEDQQKLSDRFAEVWCGGNLADIISIKPSFDEYVDIVDDQQVSEAQDE